MLHSEGKMTKLDRITFDPNIMSGSVHELETVAA